MITLGLFFIFLLFMGVAFLMSGGAIYKGSRDENIVIVCIGIVFLVVLIGELTHG